LYHFQVTKRLMDLRVEEELRRAEASRLRREAGMAHPGWWVRPCRLAIRWRSPRWKRQDYRLRVTLVPRGQTGPGI
jgi:hypothetical protein